MTILERSSGVIITAVYSVYKDMHGEKESRKHSKRERTIQNDYLTKVQ
jgi:hypothetical protein